LTDPRIERTKEHKLIDILTIAICGMICGADNGVAMEQYGHSKQEWLKQFLELPNGIPSHDTISRVFARLDPNEFEQCFRDWVKTIAQIVPGEIISIDGKTLKHSGSKGIGKKAIHLVNAWATELTLQWVGLQSIGLVESVSKTGLETTISKRYYLNSFTSNAQLLAHAVRSHLTTWVAVSCQQSL
jgi:predicted transposase YbfD/YdcC